MTSNRKEKEYSDQSIKHVDIVSVMCHTSCGYNACLRGVTVQTE